MKTFAFRWEFDRRKLFRTTDYMASMCSKFEEIAKTIGQFKRFIGPKLHSVTRSRRAINKLAGNMQVCPCIYICTVSSGVHAFCLAEDQ